MSWISFSGRKYTRDKIEILYSQIKEERRFWFDKCLSYMNFYYTINITLFTGFFLANYFERIQKMLIIMPILSLFICIYAKKVNRICHKQFLENTVIMIKLEYLLGMYNSIKSEGEKGEIPFVNDQFLGIGRHFDNMIKYKDSEAYVENELREKNRSYRYNNKALNFMMLMSFILIIYGLLANGTADILIQQIKVLGEMFEIRLPQPHWL